MPCWLRAPIAALILAGIASAASGATSIWQGGTGGSANVWNRKQNWSTPNTPGAADTAQFDNTADASNLAPSIGYSATSIGAITFTSGTTNAYDITGFQTLTVATAAGITNSSATDQQFSVNALALGANQTWTAAAAGGLLFSNTVSLGTRTLTLAGSSTGIGSITGVISGTGSLLKTGTGTWALAGASTFTGTTTVSQGTLRIDADAPSGSAGALGNATSAVTINNASTGANATALLIGASGVTIGRNVTVANAGTGTTTLGGSITSGTGTFGGGVTLNKSASLAAEGTSNIIFSGAISGSGSVTKTGSGIVELSGTNTYSGTTTISQGTLQLNANAPSGSSGTLGNATSTVTLNDANTGANNTALLIGASGVSVGRAITVANLGSGTASLGGNIASGTGTFSGTVALNRDTLLNAGGSSTITFNNVISGSGGAIKTGAGTVTLGGASSNTYSGTTTVNEGTLALAKTSSATAIAGNITIGDGTGTDTIRLDAANQIADTAVVTFTAGGTPVLNLNGYSEALGAIASSNTGAQIQFGSPGSATNFTVGGNNTSTTYAGIFTSGNANGTLVKQGTGTLTLSGASSGFTGAVSVQAGTLRVQNALALGSGTAGTTVASGGTLWLDGALGNMNNGPLTLAGTGASGMGGALVGTSGTNRWTNNIVLSGDATIAHNGGSFLSLGTSPTAYDRTNDPLGSPVDPNTLSLGGNTLTLTGTTTALDHRAISINARITGTGNVVVAMDTADDVVRFTSNYNTYTGTTTIQQGVLRPETIYNTFPNDPLHPNWFGINGPIVIGDGTGAAGSAKLDIQSGTTFSELINFNSTITLNRDGLFSLLSAQSVAGVTFNGGAIDLGTTGSLYLNGTVTVNPLAGETATISGSGTSALSLTIHNGDSSLTNRTFNVTGGVGNTSDLTIGAAIISGSMTKTGAGTMTLTGANAYEGTTTINAGILNIQNATALGNANGTSGTGTTVNSGGTLQLQGGIAVGNELLTLNGTGAGSNGALQNVSGNNSWSGAITVNDARAQSDSGLLTLGGTVTVNTALEVRGSSNTTISGAMGGSGTLTKNGTGTLTLSGNNTYGGATVINQGVVSLQHNSGLGSGLAGTAVAGSGAALELSNAANGNLNTVAEPLTLHGTGISGAGALRNIAGTNTFGGQVTLGSSSLITANSGTSLTLGGGIATAGNTLTIGTTANNGAITVSGSASGSGNLIKNGTGSLTFSGSTTTLGAVTMNAGTLSFTGSTTTLGTVNMNAGTLNFSGTTATTGAVHLNGGTTSVGGSTTLETGPIDAIAGATLTIASGGSVVADYASGTTTFSGVLAGAGEFEKTGAGTLAFNNSFTASNLTLTLDGGTLSLLGGFTFGTIHITGDTILDFNNSAGTFLSSASLIIDAGVSVTVNNWVSVANNAAQSSVWYALSTINGSPLGGTDMVGGTPLSQIEFSDYPDLKPTWVAGDHDGWFDHEIRPTPEPATYGALLLGGSLGLLGWRRWRAHAASGK